MHASGSMALMDAAWALASPLIVFATAADGTARIIDCNPAAARAFGLPRPVVSAAGHALAARLARAIDDAPGPCTPEISWQGRRYRIEATALSGGRRGCLLTDGPLDPLDDEARFWVDCAHRASVPVVCVEWPGPPHDPRHAAILIANPAAAELGGVPGGDLRGQPVSVVLGGLLDAASWRCLGIAMGSTEPREFRLLPSHPMRLRVWPSAGRACIAVDDVAYELRLERALTRQTERLAQAKRDLDAVSQLINHSIGAPMAVLSSWAELLSASPDRGLISGELAPLFEAAEALRSTAGDLLTYARMGARENTAREVCLQALVEQIIVALEPRLAARDSRVIVGRLPAVWGVEAELEVVIRSLVEHVLGTGRPEAPQRLRVTAAATRSGWRIAVHHEGCGALPLTEDGDDWTHAQPQQDLPGDGITLAMCRRIVEHQQGRIGLLADAGGGSVVWVDWPNHGVARRSIPDATGSVG